MKIILTGATGMVGEGVLLECLSNPLVTHVLSVSRKPCGHTHPKLTEYIVPEFLNLQSDDEHFKGYDACFFCAGISSIGKSETDYTRITFDTTIQFARVVLQQSPGSVFMYVSGTGTDSTEKGRSMWARVKGKTENTLMSMGFAKAYPFRPAFMKATPGQKHLLPAYTYFAWLYPVLKVVYPNGVSTLTQVGQAMIHLVRHTYPHAIITVKDIKTLAQQSLTNP